MFSYLYHFDPVTGYPMVKNNTNEKIIEVFSYDAWGRRRDPSTLQHLASGTTASSIISRGFTQHEHLDAFNLINMNGRLYDPQIGRMLSPDILVQDPTNTQAFNRYSYVMNNPLKFNDPSGYYPIYLYAINGAISSVSMTSYIHLIGEVTVHAFNVYHGDNSSPTDWIENEFAKYNSEHSWMLAYQNGSAGSSTGGIPGDMQPGSLSPLADGSIRVPGGRYEGGFGGGGGGTSRDQSASVASVQSKPSGLKDGNPNSQRGENSNTNDGNFLSFNHGIPQIETTWYNKDWGAITLGPFIIYPKNGTKNPYYNTHEPGHVLQFVILGPLYYSFVAIPSLFTATFFPIYHSEMPWEKSANQLWYWITGEHSNKNPLYHGPEK